MIRSSLIILAAASMTLSAEKPSALGAPKPGPLSATAFRELAERCAPEAPLATIRSIASVESAFNPLALSLNYPETAGLSLGIGEGSVVLARQPANLQEALNWSRWFLANGMTVSIGLMQVNVQHLQEVQLSLEQLYDPCMNLRVGWSIFQRKYMSAAALLGKGQLAMHAALSSYNSGDLAAGFQNGYVSSILNAAGRTEADLIEPPTQAELQERAARDLVEGLAPLPPPPSEQPQPPVLERQPPPPNPRTTESKVVWDLSRATAPWATIPTPVSSAAAPQQKPK